MESYGENGFHRFFDFEKVSHGKYIINEIYEAPLPVVNNRDAGNCSVYLLYIELILLKYLSSTFSKEVNFSQGKLWQLLGMVNDKYNKIKPTELKEVHESITDYEISNFYLRANQKLSVILSRALRNLSDRSLISATPETIICQDEGDDSQSFFVANDDEVAAILKVKRQVLDQFGFERESTVIFSKKRKEYYESVNSILFDRFGWKYFYKAYKIIFNRDDIDRFIPRIEMSLRDAMKELNGKIIESLNKEALSLFEKNLKEYNERIDEAICVSEYFDALHQFHYPRDYVIAQKLLADELISLESNGMPQFNFNDNTKGNKEIDDLFGV